VDREFLWEQRRWSKYRKLILFLSVGTFFARLANLALYFSGGVRHHAISGTVCVLYGNRYLMMLGVRARPK
jgi:hypothetical protein